MSKRRRTADLIFGVATSILIVGGLFFLKVAQMVEDVRKPRRVPEPRSPDGQWIN